MLAGLTGSASILCATAIAANGYTPASEDQVLQTLPPGIHYQDRPANQDAAERLSLARRWLALARETGEPRYNGQVLALLADWAEDSQHVEALVLRATAQQSLHRFDAAKSTLNKALRHAPNHPQALLTLAYIHLAQGRPNAALSACQALSEQTTSMVTQTCSLTARARTGELAQAHEELRQAYTSAARRRGSASWALTELAEQAERLGADEAANRWYLAALRQSPDDLYTLAGFADLQLRLGEHQRVLELLKDQPETDAILLRRALAENALKQRGKAYKAFRQRYAESLERDDGQHLREMARFALDALDDRVQALELAQANWREQKEPADLLLLIRAANAAGRPDAAQAGRDWMHEQGYEDSRLHLRE